MNRNFISDSLQGSKIDSVWFHLEEQKNEIENLSKTIEKVASEKLWGIFSYDTVFTVSVTLLIFTLGIIIDRILKSIDQKQKDKELKRYFKTYIDKIIDRTCPKLIEIYKDFYQNIDINSGIPTSPPKILTGDFERIKNIDDTQLFKAIHEKESLSRLLSHLDFVEKLISEVDDYHQHTREEGDKIRMDLEHKINEYFNLLANYQDHIRENQPNYEYRDEFHKLVYNLIMKYYTEIANTRQVKKLFREIIRPIQKFAVTSNIFRKDPIAYQITEAGKEISMKYTKLKRVTIDFRLQYREFKNYVEEAQQGLNEARLKVTWPNLKN